MPLGLALLYKSVNRKEIKIEDNRSVLETGLLSLSLESLHVLLMSSRVISFKRLKPSRVFFVTTRIFPTLHCQCLVFVIFLIIATESVGYLNSVFLSQSQP